MKYIINRVLVVAGILLYGHYCHAVGIAKWPDPERIDTEGQHIISDEKAEQRYILTPPPSPAPRLNGAKIIGASPGKPFSFLIAASGNRPMHFEVEGLPEGLILDQESGHISGICDLAGLYPVFVRAINKEGVCEEVIELDIRGNLALTPHMGWNSWYIYGPEVTQEDMEKSAKAMFDQGLTQFGYSFVNIDDGWQIDIRNGDPVFEGPPREENGTIRTNTKFPDMKRLADYIHSFGLKAGLYSSPGKTTCGGFAGSLGYEVQDINTYNEWGFDFLKYDWCSYEHEVSSSPTLNDYQRPYNLIGKLCREGERDIILNLCQYGMGEVWKWGKEIGGQSWRTTGDIGDTQNLHANMFRIGFFQEELSSYSGPGGWNDPDYLLFGNIYDFQEKKQRLSPYTPSEHYTCMTLWCMMSAPLIFSGDITNLDDFTKNILCNAEVIDINQDKLGKQGYKVYLEEEVEIWKKELSDGNTAIAVFNKRPFESRIGMDWAELGYSGDTMIRDLWRQTVLGKTKDHSSFVIPAHGCMLFKMSRL